MRELKTPNSCLCKILDEDLRSIDDAVKNPVENQTKIKDMIDGAISKAVRYDEDHNLKMSSYYQALDRLLKEYEKRFEIHME